MQMLLLSTCSRVEIEMESLLIFITLLFLCIIIFEWLKIFDWKFFIFILKYVCDIKMNEKLLIFQIMYTIQYSH